VGDYQNIKQIRLNTEENNSKPFLLKLHIFLIELNTVTILSCQIGYQGLKRMYVCMYVYMYVCVYVCDFSSPSVDKEMCLPVP
jgi:hypothetical protein